MLGHGLGIWLATRTVGAAGSGGSTQLQDRAASVILDRAGVAIDVRP